MPVTVKLTVSPDIEYVSNELLHMAAVCEDLTRYFREVMVPELLSDIQANIISEGDNVGGWVPTTKEYEDRKDRMGGRDRMGIFSGQMLESFDPNRAWALNRIQVSARTATIESQLTHVAHFNAFRRVAPTEAHLDQHKYKLLLENWLEFQFGRERGMTRFVNPFAGAFGTGPVMVSGGHIGRQRLRKKKPVFQRTKHTTQIQKLRESLLRKVTESRKVKAKKDTEDELARLIREQSEDMFGEPKRRGGFDDDDFTGYAGGYDDLGRRAKPGKKRRDY